MKAIYDKLAAEGGGTWATYMMLEIEQAVAAQQDGAVTFDDEECCILFLLADTEARHLRGRNDAINALREKLLPAYRDWHGANPHKVHPHSTLVCEQLEQLRRDEQ
jgi:hypothetical protein